jgi:hypothetical protein
MQRIPFLNCKARIHISGLKKNVTVKRKLGKDVEK